jgi:RNA polymerase sigma factor (sigma-70 family)
MQSDFELSAEYRAGSSAAFAALVSRHVDWVYSVALRRVGDAQLAQDVSQTVFVALAHNAKLREGGSMLAWLFQVVRYASAKAVRARKRRQLHETEAARRRPEEAQESEQQWQAVAPLLEEAVEHLGLPDRQAILLRFYQRCSFAEVGEALAISEEGARKRVSRAIAKLRKYFGSHGVTIPATALETVMLANSTRKAPTSVANKIAAGSDAGGFDRASHLMRRMTFRLMLRAMSFGMAAIAAVLAIGVGLWFAINQQPKSRLAMSAPPPSVTSEPAVRPVDITFAQLIAGVKQTEGRIQNLYIKNFDTTISKRPKGATEWVSTPMHYAGSAWYDADARGKTRVYFSDEVMAWEQGAAPWIREVQDLSWDGKEGRALTLASGSPGRGLQRMREAMVSAEEPMLLGPYARWETGAAFTLQFMVMLEDRVYPTQPRKPLSSFFERARDLHVAPEMARQTVNGFDTIRIRFGGPGGSKSYWFDSSRGYSLIKQEEELHLPNMQRTEGWEVQTLKEIQPGIWFPLRASMVEEDVPNMGSYRRYDYRAEDAVANDPHFDTAIFTAAIPSGWIVNDVRQPVRRTYVTNEDGTQLEIHTGDALPRMKAGIAQRPDGPATQISGPAAW